MLGIEREVMWELDKELSRGSGVENALVEQLFQSRETMGMGDVGIQQSS